MTRIIAGGGKGRRLKTPPGHETRPTAARVRQTLFDILAASIPGASVLDACAGSGAIGLEALSRGAARVVFVEVARGAALAIEANLAALASVGGEGVVYRQDARVALAAFARAGQAFDLVYVDPPYESDLYEPLLHLCGPLLAEDGVAVAEHFHKRALPETIGPLARVRVVRIGDHVLAFYRRAGGGEDE